MYAVIKNTAINYNGRGGMSIAAPNVEAHVEVIRRCYEGAGIDPRQVGYIEAQGMGNQVGDIAEWEASNRALEQICADRGHGYEPGFCRVSTLKPMLGHLECASALGALLKVIRTFHTDRVHAILGLRDTNPFLNLNGRPCRLVDETETWTRGERPRMAGIHSYGSGGNNAHLLIEEHVPPARSAAAFAISTPVANRDIQRELIVLSARSEDQLRTEVETLAAHLASRTVDLASAAWTLQVGRDALAHRLAFTADSAADLLAKMQTFLRGAHATGVFRGVATGNGANRAAADNVDDLDAVASSWVRGDVVDWTMLPRAESVERISLPGYAFDLRPCWFDSLAPKTPEPIATTPDNATVPTVATVPRPRPKRICIIGAGPSGLVMAKSLLEEGHEPVVFEKQRALGGLWLLNRDKTAGAYQKTRFQSSKFTSVFSDFYVEELTSTFYSVHDVIAYLRRYAEAFDLERHIHYNSEVTSVCEDGGQWTVTIAQGGTTTQHRFDGVALCQGGFWDPYIPHKEGIERFQGEVFHSGSYYDNERFRGKRVLIVGGGVSAMDIAEEAAQTARAVYWSRRTNKLILPRMVGFVPNDCQSAASLLIPENRYNIIERLQRSMPDYFEQYERSGILPSAEQFRANPVVHINDAIVGLVADGAVTATGDVERFDEQGCILPELPEKHVHIDVVVFATGYKNFGAEDSRYRFLNDLSVARDFSMGIFYAENPTLVNTAVLPIAFTGSFYFSEMIARWYAQLLSGNDVLTENELAHRIGDEYYLIMAPISSVLFGLRLGLLPSPETEFREFWRLLNYPAFPMIYRLRGPHCNSEAASQLERFRQLAYVKTDTSDPALRTLKARILAGLDTLDQLVHSGEITREEYEEALAQRENPLILDWEAQYIKRS
ncbi:MAG: NAD(P)-binding domain-containing protein, partial [Myxococcota bacterium]